MTFKIPRRKTLYADFLDSLSLMKTSLKGGKGWDEGEVCVILTEVSQLVYICIADGTKMIAIG